jgi:hypothetical protein
MIITTIIKKSCMSVMSLCVFSCAALLALGNKYLMSTTDDIEPLPELPTCDRNRGFI